MHAPPRARGVDAAFGIPGGQAVPLHAGLPESGLRHLTRATSRGRASWPTHTYAYARVCGRPGICLVITGPGVTNILTAMAQAHTDPVPMLAISAVSDRRHLGMGGGRLHELPDRSAMVSGVSAFGHTPHDLADLPAVVARAFAVP